MDRTSLEVKTAIRAVIAASALCEHVRENLAWRESISFRYTRWVNWRRGRTGHLFQGRYKAVLVDADSYLLGLTRYIH